MITTISKKIILSISLFFGLFLMHAQEILPEKKPVMGKTELGKMQRVDGIIATLGDYIILDSDIDKSFLELSSQGNSVRSKNSVGARLGKW